LNFTPLESQKDKGILTGTLRIKLSEVGIHILGIHVSKRKDFLDFTMPGRKGMNHETGEWIRYPFIVFEDRENHRELIEAIREKGRAFIGKRLADTENPMIFQNRHSSKGIANAPKETVATQ
jgi:hypothetical protein